MLTAGELLKYKGGDPECDRAGLEKIINVNSYSFKVVMISEMDISRIYNLYYGSELIAKNIHSIKQCYNEAWYYSQKLEVINEKYI